jgi:hypothetical protein
VQVVLVGPGGEVSRVETTLGPSEIAAIAAANAGPAATPDLSPPVHAMELAQRRR